MIVIEMILRQETIIIKKMTKSEKLRVSYALGECSFECYYITETLIKIIIYKLLYTYNMNLICIHCM